MQGKYNEQNKTKPIFLENIKGEYKLEQIEMYDGSPSDSLINKINRDIKALSSRSV